MKPETITAGELRALLLDTLNALHDDDEVMFGGGALTVYRPKDLGPKEGPRRIVNVEFNEVFTVHPLG